MMEDGGWWMVDVKHHLSPVNPDHLHHDSDLNKERNTHVQSYCQMNKPLTSRQIKSIKIDGS